MKNDLLQCPLCKTPCIKRINLIYSLFGIFPTPQCDKCDQPYSVGNKVRGNVFGFLLLAFIISGGFSVKYRSFWPYTFFIASMVISLIGSYFFLKPQKTIKKSKFEIVILWLAALLIFIVPNLFFYFVK